MERSKRLQQEIDRISAMTYGRTASESLKKKICVQCGRSAIEFRDELSVTEYQISALCQTCQDPIFGLGDFEHKDDM